MSRLDIVWYLLCITCYVFVVCLLSDSCSLTFGNVCCVLFVLSCVFHLLAWFVWFVVRLLLCFCCLLFVWYSLFLVFLFVVYCVLIVVWCALFVVVCYFWLLCVVCGMLPVVWCVLVEVRRVFCY